VNALTSSAAHLRRSVVATVGVLLLAASGPPARAGVETHVGAAGERVTHIRSSGRSAFANLFDPASQSSGFLFVMRDIVGDTTAFDFSWVTPVPADPRHVVLLQGSGVIPNHAFAIDRTGARLAVVTPFETLRCVVDIEAGSFDCARGPALAFDLTWVRSGIESEWLQQVSELRIGPLVVRTNGQFERRAAPVTGHFGGLPADGAMGALFDTKGRTLEREVSMKTKAVR
jgi:hypothetical protein